MLSISQRINGLWPCRVLEWSGAVFGIAGAALLASNTAISGYGFVMFFISNLFFILYGCMRQATGIVVMQLVFCVTSVLGIYRWIALLGGPG